MTGSGGDSEEPLLKGSQEAVVAETVTDQAQTPQVQRQDSSKLMPSPPPAVEKQPQQLEAPASQPETEDADEFVYDLDSTRSS